MDKLTNVKHNLLLGATEWAMTEAGAHNFINCTQVNPVKMRYRTQIWNNASTNKHRWRVTEWSAVTALQGRSVPLKISEHRLIRRYDDGRGQSTASTVHWRRDAVFTNGDTAVRWTIQHLLTPHSAIISTRQHHRRAGTTVFSLRRRFRPLERLTSLILPALKCTYTTRTYCHLNRSSMTQPQWSRCQNFTRQTWLRISPSPVHVIGGVSNGIPATAHQNPIYTWACQRLCNERVQLH